MRLSLVAGRLWLRIRYPDSGLFVLRTKRWMFVDKRSGLPKPQHRTDWYRLL